MGYAHMHEDNPQAVNDDCIRTWTISSVGEIDSKSHQLKEIDQVDVTVKLKPKGLVSSYLHDEKDFLEADPDRKVEVDFLGTEEILGASGNLLHTYFQTYRRKCYGWQVELVSRRLCLCGMGFVN